MDAAGNTRIFGFAPHGKGYLKESVDPSLMDGRPNYVDIFLATWSVCPDGEVDFELRCEGAEEGPRFKLDLPNIPICSSVMIE